MSKHVKAVYFAAKDQCYSVNLDTWKILDDGREEATLAVSAFSYGRQGASFLLKILISSHVFLVLCIGNSGMFTKLCSPLMSARPVLLLTNLIPRENVGDFPGQMFHSRETQLSLELLN